MVLKQFLDILEEAREHSITKGRNLLEQAHNVYLKWFYWSVSFAEVFNNDDWESYTARLYMESTRITESSLVLAIYGEYKPAVQVLRDWLEGVVGGLYFDLYPKEGKRWEKESTLTSEKVSKHSIRKKS